MVKLKQENEGSTQTNLTLVFQLARAQLDMPVLSHIAQSRD